MIALTRRSRSVCTIAGALAASAAFAFIPLYAHSSSAQIGHDAGTALAAGTNELLHEPRFELPSIDDPFARPLPALPPPSQPPASRNGPAPMRAAHREPDRLTVRAILTGSRAQALIDVGTSSRILAAGDAVAGSRVRTIDPTGISLADGRRFTLPEISP